MNNCIESYLILGDIKWLKKIISPGVFTNEIDQSFLPATAGPLESAL